MLSVKSRCMAKVRCSRWRVNPTPDIDTTGSMIRLRVGGNGHSDHGLVKKSAHAPGDSNGGVQKGMNCNPLS